VGRRVHPEKRSVSWVNSVLRQFLPHGPTARRSQRKELTVISTYAKSFSRYDWDLAWNPVKYVLLYGWGFFENKPLQMASLWKVDHTLGTDLENDPLPKMHLLPQHGIDSFSNSRNRMALGRRSYCY